LGLKQIALLLRERLVILDSIVPQTATERPLQKADPFDFCSSAQKIIGDLGA
jgi:hypothetical protein